ncbi:MAG: hypothetical protein ACPGUV_12145 [Polyangiales bacterium]
MLQPAPAAMAQQAVRGAKVQQRGLSSAALIKKAQSAMRAGDFAAAAGHLRWAERRAGRNVRVLDDVFYYRATLAAHQGDYDGAAKALLARLVRAERRLGDDRAFWIHNALMMVRTAQGDLAAALAESDEATRFGRRARFQPAGMSRAQLVEMKDLWHRAYLLRMMAAQRRGNRQAALLRYAEAARVAYRRLAAPQPKYQDSIAVLDGLFAALAGDKRAALRAARRVKVAENGDFEDLFLTAAAFWAGGAKDAAKAIQERIEQSEDVYLARPIMLRWLATLRSATPQAEFTPLFPSAGR